MLSPFHRFFFVYRVSCPVFLLKGAFKGFFFTEVDQFQRHIYELLDFAGANGFSIGSHSFGQGSVNGGQRTTPVQRQQKTTFNEEFR